MVKNLLLAVVSLLVCGIFLELGLRLYSAFFFPKMMVLDDKLGWKHAANVEKVFANEAGEKIRVVQNAHGHRGKFYDFKRTPEKYRILVLGDSFAEGGEVSETDLFSARLESRYPQLEVVNTGVSGYSTVQEYLYLVSAGLKFHPDRVMLLFYENDLTDNCLSYFFPFGPRPYAALDQAGIRFSEKLDPAAYRKFMLPLPFRMTLNRHSYLYYFLNSRFYYQFFWDKMQRLHAVDLAAIGEQKFEVFYRILTSIRDLLAAQRIELTVVLVPTREEVGQGFSPTLNTISEFCQQRGIEIIPLLARFQQETRGGASMYFPVDIHWTQAGHRVAAEEIGKQLRFPDSRKTR